MRKAREAHDIGISEEEKKISRALAGLKQTRRVRAFFAFPTTEGRGTDLTHDPTGDETQVLEPLDADRTQAMRRPGPLSDTDKIIRDPSKYGAPYDTTDDR
jgi:hypothetical protein